MHPGQEKCLFAGSDLCRIRIRRHPSIARHEKVINLQSKLKLHSCSLGFASMSSTFCYCPLSEGDFKLLPQTKCWWANWKIRLCTVLCHACDSDKNYLYSSLYIVHWTAKDTNPKFPLSTPLFVFLLPPFLSSVSHQSLTPLCAHTMVRNCKAVTFYLAFPASTEGNPTVLKLSKAQSRDMFIMTLGRRDPEDQLREERKKRGKKQEGASAVLRCEKGHTLNRKQHQGIQW